MRRSGVEVFMLAHKPHGSDHPMPIAEDHLQWDGKIEDAARRFNVDIVHAHWLYTLEWFHLRELAELPLPVTVRGHSFDFSVERVSLVASFDSVKRIWLFPHFAALTTSPKIRPLNACYAPSVFRPTGNPNGKVMRATAGVANKGIDGFLEVARLCPEVPFELITTRALGDMTYPDTIATNAPPNLRVRVNLQREEVATSFANGSWYLRGHDPGNHPFGMPVSIAEAMGCGMTPILPDVPAAHAYAGEAAYYYRNAEEAADVIKNKPSRRQAAIERAELYTTDVVLPEILTEWRNITKTK
jgi:hypothetical protein